MNSWPKNRIAFVVVIVLALIAVAVFAWLNMKPNPTANTVTITVWGTEPKEYMAGLQAAYSAARPNAVINYSQVPADQYDKTLITAFATGRGPDVFMIGNHDVMSKAAIILPAATTTQIVPAQLDPIFPKAVREEMVLGQNVYAVPLAMDTLAMVYNRDLFDQAGMAVPPATWQAVLDSIPKLRRTNAQGQLTVAAAALGGTESSVTYATDILSLLMLQNGAVLNSDSGVTLTADSKADLALRFYLDFSNPSSPAYTWNEAMGNSMDAFATGKVAMAFVYASDIAALKSKNPFLNFAVAPMPQVAEGQAVNYPRYPALTVWRGSKLGAWGWDFVTFAGTNPAGNKAYLKYSMHPPALRSQIAEASGSMQLFAKQSLTARAWRIPDYKRTREVLSNAIRAVLRGDQSSPEALKTAEDLLNQISP